jgi:hypothetical protein
MSEIAKIFTTIDNPQNSAIELPQQINVHKRITVDLSPAAAGMGR